MKKSQAALLLSATLALTLTATGCGKTTTNGVKTNQRGETRMLTTDHRTNTYDGRNATDRMHTYSTDRMGSTDRYRGYSTTPSTDGTYGMGMNNGNYHGNYHGMNAGNYHGMNAGTYGNNFHGMSERGTGNNLHGMTNHATTNRALEEKLARHAKGVKGVSKATVVVHNKDVLVGIDVKHGGNSASVAHQVKRSIERAEKGYNVHVTTDKKYHSRIMDMHTSMVPLDGHPVRDFSHDVGVLIRDIGRTVTAPFR